MRTIDCCADFRVSKKIGRGFCRVLRERRSLTEILLVCLLVFLSYMAQGASVDAYKQVENYTDAYQQLENYTDAYQQLEHYTDAYQQLENYGFPIGLLPHTITGYDLQENGKFAVYLESKCEIDIPSSYGPVVYSTKITGKLSYGKLRDLTGIQVKVYYFWLSITRITVKDDKLEFDVGIVSASYPIHPNFDENPECLGKYNLEALQYVDE